MINNPLGPNFSGDNALNGALAKGDWPLYYQLISQQLATIFEIKLLTFSQIYMDKRLLKRLFSSDPDSYAVGGFKDIKQNHWTDVVITKQQPFVANTIAELPEVFFDHQFIASLGLGSVINWPIIFNQQVIGTVNLLAGEGAYLKSELGSLERLYPWLLAPFLAQFDIKE